MKNKWENFLSREISVEYKASIYSLCHLFYCACYLMWNGRYQISLLQIAQITLLSYIMCNVQIYLFKNFDEADRLTGQWILAAVICSGIYLFAVQLMNWFDGKWGLAFGFGAYQLFCYVCIYFLNKIKRRIDSRHLNTLLKNYKEKR